jgi:uncharacterized protein (TIGR02145 family)
LNCFIVLITYSMKNSHLTLIFVLGVLIVTGGCCKDDIFPPTGTFTDSRDQHVYKYITVGNQIWMGENLAYLPVVSSADSSSPTEKYYHVCGYLGENVSEAKATAAYAAYGVLYNWPAAMDGDYSSSEALVGEQGVCPPGWHLPTDEEWFILEENMGMSEGETNKDGWRYSGNVGGKLKEAGTSHWAEPNYEATDSIGFTALPGGSRDQTASFCSLTGGEGAAFWTATAYNAGQAWYRNLSYLDAGIGRHRYYKYGGRSVRCVKDP